MIDDTLCLQRTISLPYARLVIGLAFAALPFETACSWLCNVQARMAFTMLEDVSIELGTVKAAQRAALCLYVGYKRVSLHQVRVLTWAWRSALACVLSASRRHLSPVKANGLRNGR